MKKDIPERPFLAYANHPLKGNPRNLHKIFDSIEHYYTVPEASRAYIRRVVDTIIELSEHNDPGVITKYSPPPVIDNANASKESPERSEFDEKDIQKAMKLLGMPREEAIKRLKDATTTESQSFPENQVIFPEEIRIPGREVDIDDMELIIPRAVEAVYGYRDGFCESTCKLKDLMIEELGQDVFSGPDRPKCYECYQTKFVRMLSMVTKRQPYSEEFLFFLNNSSKYVKRVLQPASAAADGLLEEVVFFVPEDPLFYAIKGGPYEIYKEVFHNHLYDLIAGSLAEYLIGKDKQGKPNRLRLKKCPICGTFFTGRIDKIYCSRQCKSRAIYLSPEKKEKMRLYQKDYYKPQPKTKPEFSEEEIEEIMKETNEPREEAIAILKADRENNHI